MWLHADEMKAKQEKRNKNEKSTVGRVISAVRSWYADTTICCLTQARDSTSNGTKCVWLMIFVAASAFTIVQVAEVFSGYYEFDVVTGVSVEYNNSVEFPAVSVCNDNRIHCGNLADAITVREDLVHSDNATFYELTTMRLIYKMACDPNVTATMAEDISAAASHMGDGEELSLDLFAENFLDVYSMLPMKARIEIGHQFGDLVKQCTFKSYDCLREPVFKVWNFPKYGNCFTFNSDYNENDPRRGGKRHVAMIGSHYGLSLVLNLEREGYMHNGLTTSVGARVAVFPRDVNLMPDEFGFSVAPNRKIDVAVTHRQFRRKAAPYRTNCVADWNQTLRFWEFGVTKETVYTLQQCQRLCVLDKLLAECSCVHALLVHNIDAFVQESGADMITFCQTTPVAETSTKFEQHLCVRNTLHLFDSKQYFCPDCRVSCLENVFETSISTSKWPALKYAPRAIEKYLNESVRLDLQYDELKMLQGGLLRMDVYFRSLSTEVIAESSKVTFSTFMADLGGALSLMLGISIVMLVEFVRLAWDIATAAVQGVTTGGTKR